jgi:hypothetical protein
LLAFGVDPELGFFSVLKFLTLVAVLSAPQ